MMKWLRNKLRKWLGVDDLECEKFGSTKSSLDLNFRIIARRLDRLDRQVPRMPPVITEKVDREMAELLEKITHATEIAQDANQKATQVYYDHLGFTTSTNGAGKSTVVKNNCAAAKKKAARKPTKKKPSRKK